MSGWAVSFTATVTLCDLAPAACAGLQTFSLRAGVTLPRGWLDPRTGSIPATPMDAREILGARIVDADFPGFAGGTTVLTCLAVTA